MSTPDVDKEFLIKTVRDCQIEILKLKEQLTSEKEKSKDVAMILKAYERAEREIDQAKRNIQKAESDAKKWRMAWFDETKKTVDAQRLLEKKNQELSKLEKGAKISDYCEIKIRELDKQVKELSDLMRQEATYIQKLETQNELLRKSVEVIPPELVKGVIYAMHRMGSGMLSREEKAAELYATSKVADISGDIDFLLAKSMLMDAANTIYIRNKGRYDEMLQYDVDTQTVSVRRMLEYISAAFSGKIIKDSCVV